MSWLDAMDYLATIDEVEREVGPRARSAPRGIGARPGIGSFGPGLDSDVGGPARGPRGVGPRPGILGASGYGASFGGPVAGSRGVGGPGFAGTSQLDMSLDATPYGRGWSAAQQAKDAEIAWKIINGDDGSLSSGTGWGDPFFAMAAENSGMARPVFGEGAAPSAPSAGQSTSTATGGGGWAVQDAWNSGYNAASTMTGVPANFIKAIQRIETGGADMTGDEVCDQDPDHPGDCLALNAGIWRKTAESWGLDYERIKSDPNYAILAIGTTLQRIAMSDTSEWGGAGGKTVLDEGGWDLVARIYHGGPGGYANPGWADKNGVTSGEYASTVGNYVNQLDAQGTSPGTSGQSISSPNNPASGQVGSYNGKAIADLADDYTGVNYVWGGIPTEDQDPYATGWDCSGFVRWVFDRLGYAENDIAGGLPAGSHPQAQWAIDNGRWRDGLDFSQMQAGDLIFFETGPRVGGGVDQVGPTAQRATHVGIYLGNGKMINAMQACEDLGSSAQPGVNCGTGIVAIEDGYWDQHVVGWADTSDIMGAAATQSSGTVRGGPPPANITGQGAVTSPPPSSTAVSTPAQGGTLPRQDQYGSTGNVR